MKKSNKTIEKFGIGQVEFETITLRVPKDHAAVLRTAGNDALVCVLSADALQRAGETERDIVRGLEKLFVAVHLYELVLEYVALKVNLQEQAETLSKHPSFGNASMDRFAAHIHRNPQLTVDAHARGVRSDSEASADVRKD